MEIESLQARTNHQFAHLGSLGLQICTRTCFEKVPSCSATSTMRRGNGKRRNSDGSSSGWPQNVSIPNRETILIYQPLATISLSRALSLYLSLSLSLSLSFSLTLTFSALILFYSTRTLPLPSLSFSLSARPPVHPRTCSRVQRVDSHSL